LAHQEKNLPQPYIALKQLIKTLRKNKKPKLKRLYGQRKVCAKAFTRVATSLQELPDYRYCCSRLIDHISYMHASCSSVIAARRFSAGVPMRMPLVTNGLSVSKGIDIYD